MACPELKLFREFLSHCPLPITRFERRDPPEPDILCWLDDGTEIAFEITESIDNDLAQVLSDDIKTSRRLSNRAGNENLPGLKSGVLISLGFRDDATQHAKKKLDDALFDELRQVPGDFTGKWTIQDERLCSVIERIRIARGIWDTVEFQVPAVAAIRDPLLERIQAKVEKTYQTTAPIHLLAYYDLHPCTFDGQLTNDTPFKCIWVFDRASGKVWSFGTRYKSSTRNSGNGL